MYVTCLENNTAYSICNMYLILVSDPIIDINESN